MIKYEEAERETLEYFGGDELATQVFLSKYPLQDVDGNLLESTPDDMHKRAAREFARIEAKYKNPLSEGEIYHLLKDFRYVALQGSPMAGIGNPRQITSLSNCFVIESPYDSYGGILKTDQEQAQIMKRRGGVGFDVSTIRPCGLPTSNSSKTTDGIGVFLERFSNTCREVGQGGRRGALMLTLAVNHPEIRTFINIKKDKRKVTGANLSIKLSDAFMEAVEANETFRLQWPIDSDKPEVVEDVDARELWEDIVEAAHASAEPGLLFWDNVTKYSPADIYAKFGFETVSTNPCGELPLCFYDSCRLMLINICSFVLNPFDENSTFDFESFSGVAEQAQRLMDDLVDLEIEKVDKIIQKIVDDAEPDDVKRIELDLWRKIRAKAEAGRRTGLGVTAIGDALAALNIVYGSEESIPVVEEIYKTMAIASYRSSVQMAKERGAFPLFDYELEKDHAFLNRIMDEDPQLKKDWKRYGRRNIANTTTAPAGSVSCLTQTTSGIEPAFLLSYKRRRKINSNDQKTRVDFVDDMGDRWQEYVVYHHWFKKWMEVTGLENVEDSPYHGATSNDIDWVQKVKVQAAAQKWVCHAISNTTNLPKDATKETVAAVYMTGWKSGCKGVTIYRDGCRDGVLVSTDETPEKKFSERHAPKRPNDLPCDIYHMQVRGEKWNFFVGKVEGRPYEIFAGRASYVQLPKSRKVGTISKNGKYNLHSGEGDNELVIEDLASVFENSTESAFTRTISLALRHGTPVQYVVEQINKGADKEGDMFSLSKGLGRVLKNYIEDGTKTGKKCTECGSDQLSYQEGCLSCKSCGYSRCG